MEKKQKRKQHRKKRCRGNICEDVKWNVSEMGEKFKGGNIFYTFFFFFGREVDREEICA